MLKRHAIDRVTVKFLNAFNADEFPDDYVDKITMLAAVKVELRASGFSSKSFPKHQSIVSCNFFSRTYRVCEFQPWYSYIDKVILWSVWDDDNQQSYHYFNVNEMYCLTHGVEHTVLSHDTNFIPIEDGDVIDEVFALFDLCLNFCRRMHLARFGQQAAYLVLNSIELGEEFLMASWLQFNWAANRQGLQTVYNSTNHTLYQNPFRKETLRQCKVYEKAVGLIRFEYTLHRLPIPHEAYRRKWLESLLCETVEIFWDYARLTGTMLPIAMETYIEALGTALDLSREMILYLFNHSKYRFGRDQEAVKRKLLRGDLIQLEDKRGIYGPTKSFAAIRDVTESHFGVALLDDPTRYNEPAE